MNVIPEFKTEILLALLGIALLLNCGGSKPSKFYLLTAIPKESEKNKAISEIQGLDIGIGPIKFPEYLNRPQIVAYKTTHELEMGEFDRWAEPLNENFMRVLSENLSLLLSSARIFTYPWKMANLFDYQIPLEVIHFELQANGKVHLFARWSLLEGEHPKLLVRRKSTIQVPVDPASYQSIVAGMSQAVDSLSKEMAVAVQEIAKQR
ncbi:MAG: membrane integrity-associated transporter subunit PqiC [Methanomassiliicoccales archaeon]|nr:MAG: membrane integrity-associated transporter subunit PqiC [Methanomassiliicoccales archaeon]